MGPGVGISEKQTQTNNHETQDKDLPHRGTQNHTRTYQQTCYFSAHGTKQTHQIQYITTIPACTHETCR